MIDDTITKKPVWSFTSDSQGYTLYKDGVPQGGATTLGTKTFTSDGRRRHWKALKADRAMYAEQARKICVKNNSNLTLDEYLAAIAPQN